MSIPKSVDASLVGVPEVASAISHDEGLPEIPDEGLPVDVPVVWADPVSMPEIPPVPYLPVPWQTAFLEAAAQESWRAGGSWTPWHMLSQRARLDEMKAVMAGMVAAFPQSNDYLLDRIISMLKDEQGQMDELGVAHMQRVVVWLEGLRSAYFNKAVGTNPPYRGVVLPKEW